MTRRPPEWIEPLLTRLGTARAEDFTRLTTPAEGGRESAVLVLLGEQPGEGPDVLVLQRAATLRNHAVQP
ncbi:coenzyme A pyrophosphatase, partial [Micromonospora zamorensis]